MKRLFFIASIILLSTVACVKEVDYTEKPVQKEGGMVAVTMKLKLPADLTAKTKVSNRDHNPKIDAIRVAMFGTSGYPQAYADAMPVSKNMTDPDNPTYEIGPYASTNGDIYYFKVLLPVYEGEAHVHIIANGDENITFADQTENSIMTQMSTTENRGAYWTRVVLEDGILAQLNGDGIMQTDEDGNFLPSNETAALFEDLVLVRNFAEISLNVENDAGVNDIYWALGNDPVSGSVAPVRPASLLENYEFIDNFKDYVYDPKTAKMVLAEMDPDHPDKPLVDEDGNIVTIYDTYEGYMVSTALNTISEDAEDDDITWTKWTAGSSLYSFERVDPNKTNPTFILMKAKFMGDEDYSYYRFDLMDENVGGYFPLYRNYNYQIDVSMVGNRGDSTPGEAVKRNSGGNMSQSAEAKTLTDISDGISRLYVEFVEKTFTTGGTKSFWAYYIPDVNVLDDDDNPIVDNTKIHIDKVVLGDNPALANATISLDEEKSTDTGLYFYNFTLNGQSDDIDLSSVIQIKADNEITGGRHSTLYRDITVTVMHKMDMNLWLDPKKLDAISNSTTVLHIGLDSPLQESMFPLEFYIEDTNRTLNPTGKNGAGKSISVPVKIGTSIFDDTNTNSYYFIRTVNWDEYEPMHNAWNAAKEAGESTDGIIDFTTEFKPIQGNSKTTLYVDNDYFNMQSVTLFNDAIDVTVSSSEVPFTETSVTIYIQTESASTSWTASPGTGVTLSMASGTGDDTITMSFPENQSFGNDNTYTATISSGGKDFVVTVVQKARTFNVSASSTSVAYNATSVEVEIVAEDGLSWVASVDNGAGLVITKATGETSVNGSGTHTLTVSFDVNDGNDAEYYNVTVVPDGNNSQAKSVQIVQNSRPKSSYKVEANSINNIPTNGNNAYTATYNSNDGVSIRVTNASRGGNSGNRYIQLGRTDNRTPRDGTITVTPSNGRIIKRIIVNYTDPNNAGFDSGVVAVPESYSIDSTTGVGTWTGESSSSVTITNSHKSNGGNSYSYPRVSSIEVLYY